MTGTTVEATRCLNDDAIYLESSPGVVRVTLAPVESPMSSVRMTADGAIDLARLLLASAQRARKVECSK